MSELLTAYVTLEEAKQYISQFYLSNNSLRVSWDALDDSDKQILLNTARKQIDLLPLKGKPTGTDQFPREPFADKSLEKVKEANIELAIQSLDTENRARASLKSQGVKSYKIGDLSETFETAKTYSGLDSFSFNIAFPFLQDWLGGGYVICPSRTKKCFGPRIKNKA